MCTTSMTLPPASAEQAGLDDRIVESTIGALELFGVFLGVRLGLYDTIAEADVVTTAELAAAASIDHRYAREWLEQQAVAGYLAVDDVDLPPDARGYSFPAGHQSVLVDQTNPAHVAPLARMVVGVAGALEDVVAAYRTGAGVPYERYGADFRHGQGGVNRPAFENDLIDSWLPAVDGVDAALSRGGSLADVGCGQGFSTVAIADRWPQANVVGVDIDAASIADARAIAEGTHSTARFAAIGGAGLSELGPFDVVTILESLHDMAHPGEALAAARAALADTGVLIVADELVADRFVAPGDELERMMYGWSISHCLPVARTEPDSAALGTVLRASTVEELARSAGFGSVEIVDVDGGFFRIYAIRP